MFTFFRWLNAHIVCLQEAHSKPEDETNWTNEWGLGQAYFNSDKAGKSRKNGVAISVAHLVWKMEVSRGRAAFDITFQHKTILSIKTGYRPMNFAMLPKYYIGKILPICSISAIFAHKSRYASFLHGVFGNSSCYFVYD